METVQFFIRRASLKSVAAMFWSTSRLSALCFLLWANLFLEDSYASKPVDGATFIEVHAASDQFEPNDTFNQANGFSPSAGPQTHSISPPGDVDWLVFYLETNSDVTIRTSSNAASRDTNMSLYDAALFLIDYNDDEQLTPIILTSKIVVEGLPAGQYFIRIEEFGNDQEIPSYSVTATVVSNAPGDQYEPDNSPASATTLVAGVGQAHSILPASDVDWLSFTVDVTSNITLETLLSDQTAYFPDPDSRMWLYDNNLQEIAFDDDSGTGQNNLMAKISYDRLPPGRYYIKIDEFLNDDIIDYYEIRLTAEAVNNKLPGIILMLLSDEP